MNHYLVKWKGQSSGPYSLSELKRKFQDREIGVMHEVSVDGQWITVRAFFRSLPTQNAEQAQSPVVVSSQGKQSPTLVATPRRGASNFSQNNPTYSNAMLSTAEMGIHASAKEGRTLVYAGFWARAFAAILDAAFLVGVPLRLLDSYSEEPLLTLQYIRDINLDEWAIAGSIIVFLAWIYYAFFESSAMQATLGKRMVGLIVTSESGEQISFGNASLRFFWKLASMLMLMIGFFLAAFTPRKQAFHDMMSRCLVCYPLEKDRFLTSPY